MGKNQDPGSGMGKNQDPGWVKIRIRDKHPGSATLVADYTASPGGFAEARK
jgi:hypothetical protein